MAPTEPHSFYFDLRPKATAGGSSPADGAAVFKQLTADRRLANPVSILQFGLGALQMRDQAWLGCVAAVVGWIEREVDSNGLLAYQFPMPHTFPLDPPWYSSLAQGEAGSLLVRAAAALKRDDLLSVAAHAIEPLLDPASDLVVETRGGTVLEEYPTATPSFVLNGWITSLWGLHDVAATAPDARLRSRAALAFTTGVDTLASMIHEYTIALGWSRYDLYPHPMVNVASPAYHRLHISHLSMLDSMEPRAPFAAVIEEWERAAVSPVARGVAVSRKAAFRLARPRWRQVVARPKIDI